MLQRNQYTEELQNSFADYYIFKNVIKKEDCEKILNFAKDKWQDGTVGHTLNSQKITKEIRNSDIVWCNEKEIQDLCWSYVKYANEDAGWNVKIDSMQAIQITRYKKGGHYDFHRDGNGFTKTVFNNKIIGNPRKLSMSLILNEDYQGGEFEFFGEDNLIKEKTGTIIVFPSFSVHRVRSVIKGTRYSLVAWFCGEPYK